MIRKKTLTVISIWDILDHIGLSDAEVEAISDYGLSGVSFGDATYTLIGNNFALHLIQDGIATYYDSEDVAGVHLTAEDIAEKFWQVVDEDDYINLESH